MTDPVPFTDNFVIVLLVRVWDAVRVTTVSVISGNVMVLFVLTIEAIVNVVEDVFPDAENPIFFEAVVGSMKKFVSVKKLLL